MDDGNSHFLILVNKYQSVSVFTLESSGYLPYFQSALKMEAGSPTNYFSLDVGIGDKKVQLELPSASSPRELKNLLLKQCNLGDSYLRVGSQLVSLESTDPLDSFWPTSEDKQTRLEAVVLPELVTIFVTCVGRLPSITVELHLKSTILDLKHLVCALIMLFNL